MRGSVVFDECGFLSEEMLEVYGAFAAVNKGFASGRDRNGKLIDPIRLRTFATNIPNQKFYISSASSTDTKYYKLYNIYKVYNTMPQGRERRKVHSFHLTELTIS